MAIAFSSNLGAGGSDTGAGNPTLTLQPAFAGDVGNVVLVIIGKDNVQTTDGSTSEISGITDSGSNIWASLARFANGQGAGNAGAYVDLWLSKLIGAIVSSTGTITVNKSTDVDCAFRALEFTVGAGKTMQIASGGLQTLAVDAGAPGSMTISGLPSKEYLFLRITAFEDEEITEWTPTSGWTNAPWSRSSAAGAAATNIVVRGEFIIATATGHTSNPTYAAATPDCASIFVALEEVDPASVGRGLIDSVLTNRRSLT